MPKRRQNRRAMKRSIASLINGMLLNPVSSLNVLLAGQLSLATDSSGVCRQIATCDPSGGSGSSWTSDEWTHLKDRWSMVRCLGLKCTFTSILPFSGYDSKTVDIAPAEISCNLISQTAPAAYASSIDNYGQKTWNMGSDTSRGGIVVYLEHDKKSLGWLPTSSPSAVTGPYAGCPGGVGLYFSGGPVSASRIGTITVQGYYQFRSKS